MTKLDYRRARSRNRRLHMLMRHQNQVENSVLAEWWENVHVVRYRGRGRHGGGIAYQVMGQDMTRDQILDAVRKAVVGK